MVRIFSVLAALAVLLLAANFIVGLTGGDFNTAARQKREAHNRLTDLERQRRSDKASSSAELEEARQAVTTADVKFRGPRARMTLHMLLGSAAALITVLVSSVTVTYFIGTSRWCKEVCETYSIGANLANESTRLKRSAFPWALAGILSAIVVVGLGAAADPSGANWSRSAEWVLPHYLASMIGFIVIVAAFWLQAVRIAENHVVIEQILAEVQRIRASKDLPVEVTSQP